MYGRVRDSQGLAIDDGLQVLMQEKTRRKEGLAWRRWYVLRV